MDFKIINFFFLSVLTLSLGYGTFAQKKINTGKFTIDADFPGGNIVVDSIHRDTVFIQQDLRDTEGNWFYWYFRVGRSAAGKTFLF